jgi:hypothetical protein
MSPAGWEHINLLGEYLFNSEKWSQKIKTFLTFLTLAYI